MRGCWKCGVVWRYVALCGAVALWRCGGGSECSGVFVFGRLAKKKWGREVSLRDGAWAEVWAEASPGRTAISVRLLAISLTNKLKKPPKNPLPPSCLLRLNISNNQSHGLTKVIRLAHYSG